MSRSKFVITPKTDIIGLFSLNSDGVKVHLLGLGGKEFVVGLYGKAGKVLMEGVGNKAGLTYLLLVAF